MKAAEFVKWLSLTCESASEVESRISITSDESYNPPRWKTLQDQEA